MQAAPDVVGVSDELVRAGEDFSHDFAKMWSIGASRWHHSPEYRQSAHCVAFAKLNNNSPSAVARISNVLAHLPGRNKKYLKLLVI